MYPSFTGSARRPRQVNLSGRNNNPFAASPASKNSASPQITQHTVAQAQAERLLRYQERLRPPAAGTIQRSWRGYRTRTHLKNAWRQDWDAKEVADAAAEGLGAPNLREPTPYKSEQDCLDQLRLLVHFASQREPRDMDRLILFARRYRSFLTKTGCTAPSDIWTFPLLRLGRLIVFMLGLFKSRVTPSDLNILLELLSAVTSTIPQQMASYSEEYFGALRGVISNSKNVYNMQIVDRGPLEEAIIALLRPALPNIAAVYESFAAQFLRTAEIPEDILRTISENIRIEDLARAMNNPFSCAPPDKTLPQSMNREELLWLVAYFIFFCRSANTSRTISTDTVYVSVLSKYISHLAKDLALRMDAATTTVSVPNDATLSPTAVSHPPLPAFVRTEVLSLINREHVSGLLAGAATPTDLSKTTLAKSDQTTNLAVYALTLLRAFPGRGDDIRLWLYYGSTSRKDGGSDSSIPAIKYHYHAASQTSIFRLIKEDPKHALTLLNPGARRRVNLPTVPNRDEQWQVILLFLELYPMILKVMDDEEFLTGALSADHTESWARRSALALEQVNDLTVFLKNLAFSMYWNAAEIAGVEEPENKSSIAEYFNGNLAALSENHPDRRTWRLQDATIAGVPGMTMSYMKGMVTGLLRMIYEREYVLYPAWAIFGHWTNQLSSALAAGFCHLVIG
ncbi:MAG: hypothetical protein Q9223_001985 [Gallowayella weberi]